MNLGSRRSTRTHVGETIGVIMGFRWDYMEIMEKNMETTILSVV